MSADGDKILRQVETSSRRIDAAAESAGMRLNRLVMALYERRRRGELDAVGERAYERLKRAEARLADVREAAGDAVYQIENVRKVERGAARDRKRGRRA